MRGAAGRWRLGSLRGRGWRLCAGLVRGGPASPGAAGGARRAGLRDRADLDARGLAGVGGRARAARDAGPFAG